MKKLIVCIVLMLLFPLNAKANIFCKTEQIVRYQKLASDINYSYTYTENGDNISFNIKIYNFNKEVYLVEDQTGRIIHPNQALAFSEVVLNNYAPNKTYKYSVYPYNSDCADMPVHTLYVTLPAYNKYYKSEYCKGIEDYKLCYKWENMSIEENKFKELTDNYRKSLIKEEEKVKENDNVNYIWEFYQRYYLIILPVIISVLMTIIVVNAINKRKKDTFGF